MEIDFLYKIILKKKKFQFSNDMRQISVLIINTEVLILIVKRIYWPKKPV